LAKNPPIVPVTLKNSEKKVFLIAAKKLKIPKRPFFKGYRALVEVMAALYNSS
jgi:hypothetical protein